MDQSEHELPVKHPDFIAWEKWVNKNKGCFNVNTITSEQYLYNRLQDAFYSGRDYGESKAKPDRRKTPNDLHDKLDKHIETLDRLIARLQLPSDITNKDVYGQ